MGILNLIINLNCCYLLIKLLHSKKTLFPYKNDLKFYKEILIEVYKLLTSKIFERLLQIFNKIDALFYRT